MRDMIIESLIGEFDSFEDADFDTDYEDQILRQWGGLAKIVDDAAADAEDHEFSTVLHF